MTNILTWTLEGKSVVSSWGTYALRVKRLGRGRYWWVVMGVLEGRRSVKLKDGMVACQKVGRNEAEAALCSVCGEYQKERLAHIPWYRRSRVKVGRHWVEGQKV